MLNGKDMKMLIGGYTLTSQGTEENKLDLVLYSRIFEHRSIEIWMSFSPGFTKPKENIG